MAPAAQICYSPFDYAVHEDPYPFYARLRDEAPLYRNDELGFWALSRHADVSAAFRDHATFSNSHGVSLEPSAWGPQAHRTMSFLALDPPRHTRMRALVSKGFTPRRVKEMADGIRALARRHLEPALDKREFDFVADFAGLLPMDVISEMMGVPEADRAEVRRLADLVVHREEGLNDVPPAGMEAALTLVGYYQDMVAERRRRPSGDLTSALLDAEIDGDRLDDTEIIAFLFLMVVAGNETTTKLLANALYWGSLNPSRPPSRSATPRGSTTGSRRRSATTPPARCSPGSSRGTWNCTGGASPRGTGCCCWWGRPTATRGSSRTPTSTTSTATPPSSSVSAAAGTSAWAPTSPAWRRASRWASWCGASRPTRSTTSAPSGCTR